MMKGKTLEEAEKITNKDIADYLGGLPEQKMHCSVMGREALQAAIENYRSGKSAIHELEGEIVCKCFGVTDKEIETVVRENNLHTVEQVTNYCKAGGGCGNCKPDIQKIIDRICKQEVEEIISDHGGAGNKDARGADGFLVDKGGTASGGNDIGNATGAGKVLAAPRKLTNIQKIKLIEQTLDEQVRPALQTDGGDLELIDIVDNKVIVALRGMCAKCQVAEFTLKDVVEKKLRDFVSPDIVVVQQ